MPTLSGGLGGVCAGGTDLGRPVRWRCFVSVPMPFVPEIVRLALAVSAARVAW